MGRGGDGGGGYEMGGGCMWVGVCTPTKGGGGGKSFSHAEGGQNKF